MLRTELCCKSADASAQKKLQDFFRNAIAVTEADGTVKLINANTDQTVAVIATREQFHSMQAHARAHESAEDRRREPNVNLLSAARRPSGRVANADEG